MNTAKFVAEVSVLDTDTMRPCNITIYKCNNSTAMFGIDSEFLMTLSEDDPVVSPFDGEDIVLLESHHRTHSKAPD